MFFRSAAGGTERCGDWREAAPRVVEFRCCLLVDFGVRVEKGVRVVVHTDDPLASAGGSGEVPLPPPPTRKKMDELVTIFVRSQYPSTGSATLSSRVSMTLPCKSPKEISNASCIGTSHSCFFIFDEHVCVVPLARLRWEVACV